MSEHVTTVEVVNSRAHIFCTCGWSQRLDTRTPVTTVFEAAFNHVVTATMQDVADVFTAAAVKLESQSPLFPSMTGRLRRSDQ
jgi:hypothetical protein